MDNVMIKNRLHDYIEQADEDLLLAIYVLLNKLHSTPNSYDEKTLKNLYKRVELEEQQNFKFYSKEDAMEYIRSKKINNNE